MKNIILIILSVFLFACEDPKQSQLTDIENQLNIRQAHLQMTEKRIASEYKKLDHVLSKLDSAKSEYEKLPITQKEILSSSIAELSNQEIGLKSKVVALKEIENDIKVNNKKFILKLRLKQSRFSLSISEHMKDSMNAAEFEIPVDKDFYDSVSVGTQIVDKFRAGSFIINGSFSDWNVTVLDKRVQ